MPGEPGDTVTDTWKYKGEKGDHGFPGLPGIDVYITEEDFEMEPGRKGREGNLGQHGIPGRPGIKGAIGDRVIFLTLQLPINTKLLSVKKKIFFREMEVAQVCLVTKVKEEMRDQGEKQENLVPQDLQE